MRRSFLLAIPFLLALGCSTYRDDLNRGQRLYLDAQYDHALAIWRVLETDFDSLTYSEQARYAYLRGMTAFRLGYRADARHWLAVSHAIDDQHRGGLSSEASGQLQTTLDELNAEVWGTSAAASAAPAASTTAPPATE